MSNIYYHFSITKLLICFLLCISNFAFSQPGHHQAHIFDTNDLLKIKLETDIGAILEDRGDDPHYHQAILSFKDANKNKVALNVKLRSRGNFRKHPGNCVFPPLRVKFDEEEVEPTIFHDNKKLKLVTHCQEEASIVKEYLIYRTLNLLTPYSFKVRLARIYYKDTQKQYPPETWYAFFIEDGDDVAKRNGGKEISEDGHDHQALDQEALASMYLFNAMVGNTDWDLRLAKNLKFIEFRTDHMPVAIPYDFDWCAAVNASYTKLETKDYEEMRYRSFCSSEIDFRKHIQHFKDTKADIQDLFYNCKFITKNEAKKVLDYFEEFYQEIENDYFIEERLLKDCQN